MTKVQKTDNTNCWQWWEKQDLLHTAGGIQTGNETLENGSFFRSNLWSIHKVALRLFTQINTKTVWPHTQMYKNVSSHTSRVESTQDPSRDEWVAGLSYAQVNPHTMLLSMKRHERNRHKGISLKTGYILCFQLFMFWKRQHWKNKVKDQRSPRVGKGGASSWHIGISWTINLFCMKL